MNELLHGDFCKDVSWSEKFGFLNISSQRKSVKMRKKCIISPEKQNQATFFLTKNTYITILRGDIILD